MKYDLVDQAKTAEIIMKSAPYLEAAGIRQGTQGFNRVMANVADLASEDIGLAERFLSRLPEVVQNGTSIEAVAKARADSYQTDDGRWVYDKSRIKSYNHLYNMQRTLAGMYDYNGVMR